MKTFNLVLFFLLGSLAVFSQPKQPKTVRDFFNLLPQSYFTLESCRPKTDKNCVKARKEYLKRFLEVEDNANRYFEASGDGSQEKLKMTLFKRPDKTYLIGLYVYGEWGEKYYFLEYKSGKWSDVSRKIIPNYKKSNIYEIPRKGTTVAVFERINYDAENQLGETGKKLYDLVWKNGKFSLAN
jgi:hypothetical protein